jgi:hypothetical protein
MVAGLRSQHYILELTAADINVDIVVILLSFVLAVGFLMIILSCALWHNWLPLLVGASHLRTISQSRRLKVIPALTFVLAPLPNAIFSHCGSDEFVTSYGEGSGPIDVGRFLTSIIVVSGLALPIILAHSEVIDPRACVMSIIGGRQVNPSH